MRVIRDPEISLVLPAYNEQDNIAAVLAESVAALEQLGRSWEIIVVDNHSSDGTAAAVEAFIAYEPRVRLVVHGENRFYSGSCETALRESRGTYVAIMDSDGQFTARDLPKFLREIEGGANLVFGWRRKRHDPVARKAMSWVFNALGKFYLGYPLHDLNVGIRMFDRTFRGVARVRHRINMVNPEFFVCARRAGLKLAEVEIEHFERTKGASSHNFGKLVQLFRTVHRYFRTLRDEAAAEPERPALRKAA